ncbi:MAG: DUF1592 domain-containing protein [Rubripirellula sp.]
MLQSHRTSRRLLYAFSLASILPFLMFIAASATNIANAQEETQAPSTESEAASLPEIKRDFLRAYCFDCHDSANQEGQLDLEEISFDLSNIESAARWQKVLDAINSGEMPPEDATQPTASSKADFLEALSGKLVIARQILSDSGGVITMRRLNRREYANTIRTLLGVDIELDELPSDADPGSFDTSGASLYISSDQIEKYLSLGRQAVSTLIASHTNRKQIDLHKECETETNRVIKKRRDQLLKRHKLAEDWRKSDGRPPTDFGYIDASRVQFEEGQYKKSFPAYDAYLNLPSTSTGVAFTVSQAGAMVNYTSLPTTAPAGEYLVRIRVGRLPHASPQRSYIEYGNAAPGARTGEIVVRGHHKITGTYEQPEIIEFPLTINHDNERKIALRERQPNTREAARTAFNSARSQGKDLPPPAIWLDWVEIIGPINRNQTKKHFDRLFPSSKDSKEFNNARFILKQFAERAFRSKQPSENYLDRLEQLYQEEKKSGLNFKRALVTPLAAVLASPSFLYLQEPNDSIHRRALTDQELAVRLSYLLWSGPPDQRLLYLAGKGKLRKPAILEEETERLLADPRSIQFVRSFTHQWLQMERLDFFQFNFVRYPQFDESMKMAAREEVFQTFDSLLRNDGSLGKLIKSDHIVINEILADYYGLPGVSGNEYQRVPVPPTSPRGGLLGMAAILAMGSDGERASPVERGAWVLRKVLHNPPPPAPANVPQLSRLSDKLLSVRELQAAHMEEPQCAQCHRKIDPIGFGLHNFDATGQWREKEKVRLIANNKVRRAKTHVIDPSGTLPNGDTFANFFELRDQIAKQEQNFARGFSESLIEYGLGRPYGFSDRTLADKILAEAGTQGNQISAFIHALVQSKAFRQK